MPWRIQQNSPNISGLYGFGQSANVGGPNGYGYGYGQSMNLGGTNSGGGANYGASLVDVLGSIQGLSMGGAGGNTTTTTPVNSTGWLSSLNRNAPALQLGLGALSTLGGLYQSNRMMDLARDQFRHARDVTNTNLTNQIQSYNTALAGRANARGVMEGRDQESINRYIEENKLSR